MTDEQTLTEALKRTGFERCEFKPDDAPCENCGKQHVQLYFGNTDYWDCREGDYSCAECVIALYREASK